MTDDHILRNRKVWDGQADRFAAPGRRGWSDGDPHWGIWRIPETELTVLPDVDGRDVLEAGCGTAYWASWLIRRGARVVGLDNSSRQLATARELRDEHGVHLPLVQADAERLPFADRSFDVVFSEYGASLWCDPHRWIPEAARVLRPDGDLIFLSTSPLLTMCLPDEGKVDERLKRPLFGLHHIDWADDDSTEFQLPHGEMIRLLIGCGFEVTNLIEIQAPEDADPGWFDHLDADWAHMWPIEEIWRARRV